MHVLIGKRQLVLAGLVVMLGLAVFVNWYFTNNGAPLSPEGPAQTELSDAGNGAASYVSSEAAAEFFAEAKHNREVSLAAALEKLEAVMASSGAAQTDISAAQEQIAALTAAAKLETDIESLVSAQTGGDCVAVVGDNAVEVIVTHDMLNDTAVLQISDIIHSVCGSKYENIRVSAAIA